MKGFICSLTALETTHRHLEEIAFALLEHVEVRNPDLAVARQQQAARAAKLLAALRAAGVTEGELQSS